MLITYNLPFFINYVPSSSRLEYMDQTVKDVDSMGGGYTEAKKLTPNRGSWRLA